MNAQQKQFLAYIGGLRGFAILMVVLFHMMPQYFSQGYLGVDVFFVISGFLLFRAYDDEKQFSLRDFVCKKVLRIYPVLACTVVLTSCLMALCLYSWPDVADYVKTVTSSLYGLVNYFFDKEYTNYFSANANMNPLLHLWYLAVIIQVYLLWGIGCWCVSALCKWKPAYMGIIGKLTITFIVLISVFSYFCSHLDNFRELFFLLGCPALSQTQEMAYWHTFGRVWQLAAGGLVLVLPTARKPWQSALMAGTGIFLILILGFCNVPTAPYAASMVVAGTVLVLRYIPDVRLRCLFEQRCLTWLGGISFSLYLVHFPLLVFYKRWVKDYPDVTMAIALIGVSLILAYFLWRFVERKRFTLITTLAMVAIACLFTFAVRSYLGRYVCPRLNQAFAYPIYEKEPGKVPQRYYDFYDKELLVYEGGTQGILYNGAKYPNSELMMVGSVANKPEFIMMGDSNSQHWYAGMNELCLKWGVSGIHLDSIVIPLMDRFEQVGHSSYRWDEEKAKALFNWLEHQKSIRVVVISQLWLRLFKKKAKDWNGRVKEVTFEENVKRLKEFCQKIQSLGKRVVLMMPGPLFLNMHPEVHGTGLEYVRWVEFREKYRKGESVYAPLCINEKQFLTCYERVVKLFNEWERNGFCDVIHVEEIAFEDGYFKGYENGVLYCKDRTHLTPPAAIKILDGVGEEFKNILHQGFDEMNAVNR